MPDPISPDRLARDIRQLRTDVANARECEDDYVEVPTGAVETVLAEVDRLNASHTRALELADETKLTLFQERNQALAQLAEARAEVDRLTAELAKAAEQTETPLTGQLFVDLMSMPSLGSTLATVRLADANDGRVVTIAGRAINIGLGPQLKATSRREARDRVQIEIALPIEPSGADPTAEGDPA